MPAAGYRMALAFGAQSEEGFNWYTYSTADRLAEVLAPGYFDPVRKKLRPGDLLLVGTEIPPPQPWYTQRFEQRRALLMVASVPEQGPVTVRLVADFGTPADPSLSLAEERTSEGR